MLELCAYAANVRSTGTATMSRSSRARLWTCDDHGLSACGVSPTRQADEDKHAAIFNSRIREECQNANAFLSLASARNVTEASRQNLSTTQPHSSIGRLAQGNTEKPCMQEVKSAKPSLRGWYTRRRRITSPKYSANPNRARPGMLRCPIKQRQLDH